MSKLGPVNPGELLAEEFLRPMGITNYRLAKEIGVPAKLGKIRPWSAFGAQQRVRADGPRATRSARR